MKTTGIVRPLDNLGRIVIPVEIRRTFEIEPKALVEIYVDGDKIILEKYSSNRESEKKKPCPETQSEQG